MKAIQKLEKTISLNEVEKPSGADEALVRVVLSGICNTDLEIARGYANFQGTIGHEFVGVVEECAVVPKLVGKRVLGEINVGCETCDWCSKYDARHCPNRTVLGIVGRDGCHAEFLNLPARNLIEVPGDISDERAVFAEPLAAAYGITERVNIDEDTSIAVIGDGKLGILCAWALAAKTQHLFLIGKHPNKLRIGELGNAEGVILDDAAKMKRRFDVVVEASGSESGFATALDLVRPRGELVLKSTFHGTPKWEAWRVVVDEISVVGSRCGMFGPVIDLLKDSRYPLEELISGERPLTRGVEALDEAEKPGVMKILLRP
ncbi:MAG: alcohol dehydrogenase catalytic domain-containing protein [Pyrinomonadaceae bacterium]|nr:alcohol dehydrogenase catalytic domain-containing protein [Pyrinomonadaceae bacterium]